MQVRIYKSTPEVARELKALNERIEALMCEAGYENPLHGSPVHTCLMACMERRREIIDSCTAFLHAQPTHFAGDWNS
jgi:hypothetical protein